MPMRQLEILPLQERRQLLVDWNATAVDFGADALAPRLGAAFYPEDGGYAEDLLAAAGSRLSR